MPVNALAATVATLLVLPAIFAIIQGRAGKHSPSLDPDDPLSVNSSALSGLDRPGTMSH